MVHKTGEMSRGKPLREGQISATEVVTSGCLVSLCRKKFRSLSEGMLHFQVKEVHRWWKNSFTSYTSKIKQVFVVWITVLVMIKTFYIWVSKFSICLMINSEADKSVFQLHNTLYLLDLNVVTSSFSRFLLEQWKQKTVFTIMPELSLMNLQLRMERNLISQVSVIRNTRWCE